MNFLTDPAVQSVEVSYFDGPSQLLDEEDIKEPQGLSASNAEYIIGQVRTRRGFAQAFNPNTSIHTLYNWIQIQYNRLIYLTHAGAVVSRDLRSLLETTLVSGISAGTHGMVCAQAGYRLYMAFFGPNSLDPTNPVGTDTTRVWDGTIPTGGPAIENVFPTPFTTSTFTTTIIEPFAGLVTAGTHHFKVLFKSWNGADYYPSPTNLDVSFTSSGGKTLSVTLTPVTTWPLALASARIIMTTADNPNRWFIIPGSVAISRGGAASVNISINLDDNTLLLEEEIISGTSNDFFALLTGNILANAVIAYGVRMVYLFNQTGPDGISISSYIAISEPTLPQWVTEAQHVLLLPEFRQANTGFVLGSVLYIVGPHWIYAFSDNGLAPVDWAQPRLVSGAIGTLFVKGVLANPAFGYCWIADQAGLFWFGGGALPVRPTSYLQTPDWHRINFTTPNLGALEIIEDTLNRLVIVKAPLDGATNATHFLVWDYADGFTWDTIRYCGLWNISGLNPGGCGIVHNPASHEYEFWVSRDHPDGNVLRRKSSPFDNVTTTLGLDDPALYDDDGAGIDFKYRQGPFPGVPGEILDHIGADLRIRGNGTAQLTSYSLDQINPVSMSTIPLSAAPGRRFFRAIHKQSESVSYEVSNQATAGWFVVLSAIKSYFRRWAMRT